MRERLLCAYYVSDTSLSHLKEREREEKKKYLTQSPHQRIALSKYHPFLLKAKLVGRAASSAKVYPPTLNRIHPC